jgi:RNA polymerase sigma factor (sigma-70 family)
MSSAQLRTLLRQLHQAAADGLGDADLLERFVRDGDEAAFELLVWRHGAMVLGACRRILRHHHDAEDAFQATFLLLARKARSVRRGAALAGWLHRVARRVALRARGRAGRAAQLPEEGPAVPEVESAAVWADLRPVLDEEVGRLPEKYRLPVLLCYLGGLSTEEAARRLGCPRGTVLSRLAWARRRLRGRLERRGLALSAGAMAAGLAREAASAAAPAALAHAAVRAARWLKAGKAMSAGEVPGRAVSLMEGVLHAMFMTKLKTAAAGLLVLALVGLGMGLWSQRPATADTHTRKVSSDDSPAGAPGKVGGRDYEPPRPLGDWEHVMGPHRVTLRVEANHISGTCSIGEQNGKRYAFNGRGDYGLTKDGVLYGVLTDLDCPDDEDEAADLVDFIDQPFSCRFRVDGDILIVKDLKFAGVDLDGNKKKDDLIVILQGRYKRKTASR